MDRAYSKSELNNMNEEGSTVGADKNGKQIIVGNPTVQINGLKDIPADDLTRAKASPGVKIPLSNACSLQKIITFYTSGGNVGSFDFNQFRATVQKTNNSN